MTPQERQQFAQLLESQGWIMGWAGWHSPDDLWHVDVDRWQPGYLVLTHRMSPTSQWPGESWKARVFSLQQAIDLLAVYRAPFPVEMSSLYRLGRGLRVDDWPARFVSGSAEYDRVDDTDTNLPPDVGGYPVGRWAR